MQADNDFGFRMCTECNKHRITIPASIVEFRKISEGQVLFAKKCKGVLYVMLEEPDEDYISLTVKAENRIILPQNAGFDDFFTDSVKILEFKGGFKIYPEK